jgi:hypothetical protein
MGKGLGPRVRGDERGNYWLHIAMVSNCFAKPESL